VGHLGRLLLRARQLDRARDTLHTALEDARARNNLHGQVEMHMALAALAQAEGAAQRGLDELEKALAVANDLGDLAAMSRLQQLSGRLLVGLGRQGDAAGRLRESMTYARRIGWDEGVSIAQQMLAVVDQPART
jgi:hypothetical protein